MFSKISSSLDNLEKRIIFKKSLFYVLISSVLILIIFYFFSREILIILFGETYANGDLLLKWMGVGLTLISILQLKINYILAQRE